MTTKYAARALESGRWQWISGGKTRERDAREYADKYRKEWECRVEVLAYECECEEFECECLDD